MVVRSALALALCLSVASARGEWSVVSTETEKGSTASVEHRHVVLAESGTGDSATVDFALFTSKSAAVRFIDNPSGDDDLAAVMRRSRALAGVNGGYFDPQDAPV